jgi:hypothetical protein
MDIKIIRLSRPKPVAFSKQVGYLSFGFDELVSRFEPHQDLIDRGKAARAGLRRRRGWV